VPPDAAVDDRPPGPRHLAQPTRWLGFQPRTVVVVAILLAVVMVGEYLWLYTPFGSTTVTTTQAATDTTDPGAASAGDAGTDPSTVPGADPAVTYAAIGTVTIRSSPATSGTRLGKLPRGTRVAVICTTIGDPVRGATKTDSHWDKITYDAVTGYVSNTLMATGTAIDDPTLIPPC
jgi:uncharacterized protein YraI